MTPPPSRFTAALLIERSREGWGRRHLSEEDLVLVLRDQGGAPLPPGSDHLVVRRTYRAPATTSTAMPATKTQLPHQRRRLTRPTTMRIAEITASRVRNGWAVTRGGV